MRGLLRVAATALGAAPALVSAVWTTTDFAVNGEDVVSTLIQFPVPGVTGSHDADTLLSFSVQVNAFEEACGFGNIVLNGQPLVQKTINGDSNGEGLIASGGQIVDATWTFRCLHEVDVDPKNARADLPDAQILDFTVRAINGEAVVDAAFWIKFRQYPKPQIISAPLWIDDAVEDTDGYNFNYELAQLEWMKMQVMELEYQIYMKEEAILQSTPEDDLNQCDNMKCVFKGLLQKAGLKAHKAMRMIYSKIAGYDMEAVESGHPHRPPWKRPHWRRPHWRKPHWRRPPFHHGPKHGNHSHGNHTCRPPHHGNHTHRRPHPHPHPPPWVVHPQFCQCGPPPPHGLPPKGPPGHLPPGDRPHPHPPSDDEPPFEFEGVAPTSSMPATGSEPPTSSTSSTQVFRRPNSWYKHRNVRAVVLLAKVIVVGALLSLLIGAVRRCCCSNARRQAKRAKREERWRRRSFRHAALKHSIRNWIVRHFCRGRWQDMSEEEKRAMLAAQAAEAESDAVGSEISEFQNAASIVSDIVAAEEGRVSMDSRSSLPEYMSEVGGERLPIYDDDVTSVSDLSSAVVDGFRYTPGSTEYSPLNSEAGSVQSVLGDIKE